MEGGVGPKESQRPSFMFFSLSRAFSFCSFFVVVVKHRIVCVVRLSLRRLSTVDGQPQTQLTSLEGASRSAVLHGIF